MCVRVSFRPSKQISFRVVSMPGFILLVVLLGVCPNLRIFSLDLVFVTLDHSLFLAIW